MKNIPQTDAKVAVYAAQMTAPKQFDWQDGLGFLCCGLATLLSVWLSASV